MRNLFAALVLVPLLSACGGGDSRAYDPAPELVRFDMVDSYGVDTQRSSMPLAVNPYLYSGMFDISWWANSLVDYRVTLWANDIPSLQGAIYVYSQACGSGRSCDQDGSAICSYTSDFYLSCNNSHDQADIAVLFKQVPQRVYLVMEICTLSDTHCSYTYRPVSME